MKNLKILSAILTTALILTLTFASCGGGGGGSGPAPALPAKEPQKTIYRSEDEEGNVYRLEVTENVSGRAAYTPQKGDTYVLTIFWKEEGKGSSTSSGTVETTGGTLTLKPTVATATFTITISTVSGVTGITAISGTITFDPEEEGAETKTEVIPTDTTFTPKPLTTIDQMDISLSTRPANTPATAYSYQLKVDELDYSAEDVLKKYEDKYVKLEFLQGTKTSINIGFWECKTIVSIIFPNNLTSIGDWNYGGLSNLTSVTLPNSLKEIEGGSFMGATSLTSITIPNGVTRIGDWSFMDCKSLTSITIPNSVTIIDQGAFNHCTSLSSVNIPNNVTKINFMAFNDTNLTSITIPASVTKIEGGAFSDCNRLTSVTFLGNSTIDMGVPDTEGFWSPFDGDLQYKFNDNGAGTYTRPYTEEWEWWEWTKQQ